MTSLVQPHIAVAATQLSKVNGIRLVTYNAYLLPLLAVKFHKHNKTSVRQDERAHKLGALLSRDLRPDVICLQEVWGSQVSRLEDELKSTYYVPKRFRSVDVRGIGSLRSSVLDTIKFQALGTGGLWFASAADLPVVFEDADQFRHSATRSGKGMFAALLDTSLRKGVPPLLLVINCHLDPDYNAALRESQMAQISELRKFVNKIGIRARSVAAQSNKEVACLICGDMNAHNSTAVYAALRSEIGSTTDVLAADAQRKGLHQPPPTYSAINTLSQWRRGDHPVKSQTLDHVFMVHGLNNHDLEIEEACNFSELHIKNVSILRQPPSQELSDHWGVCCDFGSDE